jgi:hypothetical protein
MGVKLIALCMLDKCFTSSCITSAWLFETGSCSVAQFDLELQILLLPLSSKCSCYCHVPPCVAHDTLLLLLFIVVLVVHCDIYKRSPLHYSPSSLPLSHWYQPQKGPVLLSYSPILWKKKKNVVQKNFLFIYSRPYIVWAISPPFPPPPTSPSSPRFQEEHVMPFSPILLKRRHKQ